MVTLFVLKINEAVDKTNDFSFKLQTFHEEQKKKMGERRMEGRAAISILVMMLV